MKPQKATTAKKETNKKAVVYVTRDIERALGMEPGVIMSGPLAERGQGRSGTVEYFIITNRSHYAETVASKYPEYIWLVDRPAGTEPLDTFDILNLDEVKKNITKSTGEYGVDEFSKPNMSILVFKNTLRIEKLAKENGWNLINPSAVLADTIEGKISQVKWLGDLTSYLPAHQIAVMKNVVMEYETADKKKRAKPLVLQWAHGHTGLSTIIVSDEKQLNEIKKVFPDREVRVSEYIKGPTFTVNVVVASDSISLGNISYQITGALPFTDNPLTTIGNDWGLTHSLLSEKQLEKVEEIARAVGEKARSEGWQGLFGIDIIHDEERDEIRLIEINARQPASTTYESQLQLHSRALGVSGSTIFEAHVQALIGEKTGKETADKNSTEIIPINDGAQVIQRVTSAILASEKLPNIAELESAGLICISYENSKLGSDLLRIQSARGIMETHNKFNARGKEIVDVLIK